jgi:hypothetical protein
VFAFNLMLVPIHLAGVLKSIQQGLTGNRVPFGRTPKVPGRTASPRWAVLAMWGMLAWSVMAASFDAFGGRWGHTTFAMVTAGALAYAVTAFVGVRASVEDAMQGWSITTPRLDARSEAAARIGDRPTR